MFKDYRFVAVGSRLFYSKRWRTFHDFLFEYIRMVFGPAWGTAEIKKPLEQRHPILRWYDRLCTFQERHTKKPGAIQSARPTAAVAAYLRLAHDLWTLEHNVELQEKLIQRLKNPDQFPGAHYETFVAACFIRAGFDIEFENENDRSTTHCEFTATHRKTRRAFSVEAKHRRPGDQPDTASGNLRIGRRLAQALRKRANHQRVVFLDLNVPDKAVDTDLPGFFKRTLRYLRNFEHQKPGGQVTPSAYVVITNNPHEYDLDSTESRSLAFAEGFKIPDFRHDAVFLSIREAVDSREAHRPIVDLLESLRVHSHVPSAFDGTIPEFAFEQTEPRMIIGERYLVPDASGADVAGVLESACVNEVDALAFGIYLLEDGRRIVATSPLTDSEIRAYRRMPETFFGVIQPVGRKIEPGDALGLYDFFFSAYKNTPKETLLAFCKDAADIDALRSLSQAELARVVSERYAHGVLQDKKG